MRPSLLANAERFSPGLNKSNVFSDIVDLDYTALLEAAGLAPGEAGLVHGGPPCTPFSKSGYWLAYKRAGEDPKASLLDNYVEGLQAVKPKAFLMENVYGLASQNQNRPILNRFVASVRAAGYSFDSRIILAADHGVPQMRQRLICVGIRDDLLDVAPELWRFDWPAESHTGPHERRIGWDTGLEAHVTAGQALAGLADDQNPREPEEEVSGTYARELHDVPPGDNYLFFTENRGHPEPLFEWRSRYWSFLLKLHPERPSPTIQGQPGPWVGPFHWESRRLRVAELKRLMTFPDEYVVCGNRRDQQLQLGNEVPPLLGQRIAEQIAAEDNIGTHDSSWDSERQVLSEPQAPPMQLRTQRDLGARVAARITAHPCADRRAGWLWIWEQHEFWCPGSGGEGVEQRGRPAGIDPLDRRDPIRIRSIAVELARPLSVLERLRRYVLALDRHEPGAAHGHERIRRALLLAEPEIHHSWVSTQQVVEVLLGHATAHSHPEPRALADDVEDLLSRQRELTFERVDPARRLSRGLIDRRTKAKWRFKPEGPGRFARSERNQSTFRGRTL